MKSKESKIIFFAVFAIMIQVIIYFMKPVMIQLYLAYEVYLLLVVIGIPIFYVKNWAKDNIVLIPGIISEIICLVLLAVNTNACIFLLWLTA